MATGQFRGFLADDAVIYASASATAAAGLISVGDWTLASSYWVLGANSATIGSPAFRTSGMGVALGFNPDIDERGTHRANSALPIATRGIFRVTGTSGASGEFPMWTPVYPRTTGSGFNPAVAATGATGIGSIWGTAPMQGISANPTGALASGVGRLLRVITDGATGQWDIVIEPAAPGYF